MKQFTSFIVLIMVAVPNPLWAQSVVRDGMEWLQPAALVDISGNEIFNACPPPTWICTGVLAGIDVSGYSWASGNEVASLFNSYGIDPPLVVGSSRVTSQADSKWGPAILSDFDSTKLSSESKELVGMTRDNNGAVIGILASVVGEVVDSTLPNGTDTAGVGGLRARFSSSPNVGSWLSRPARQQVHATQIPSSSPISMILLALGLLVTSPFLVRKP